jgi:Transposase DDE domain
MPTQPDVTTVKEAFFHLIELALANAAHTRPCPELPDADWIHLGVQRVLEGCESGRAFLQEHGLRFERPPTLGNYFASLRSERRGQLVGEVARNLVPLAEQRLVDRLADIPELGGYACFACDGHWHKAATHDPRHQDTKMAVGHFYSLDLRFHSLRHLAAGQGLHEHDMSALKRLKPKGLRQGVPKGRRVLIIYDKAGVDLGYWKRCRQECAVYFLSRPKENMPFGWEADRPWDRADARNHGVLTDHWVSSRDGHRLRLISYLDHQSGTVFEFLTNEPDLPPGVIAELYRRRWEAEKVFDELKNKLGQQKAWATTLAAKEAQAHLIAITHNLLLCYETALESRHGVQNQAEDHRRRQRVVSAAQECARIGWPLPELVLRTRRATQRSVKLIRWMRHAIREGRTEAAAVPHLRSLYATM